MSGTQRQQTAYFVEFFWCPEGDLNPHDRLRSADFKSAASANFAIRADADVFHIVPHSHRGTMRFKHSGF